MKCLIILALFAAAVSAQEQCIPQEKMDAMAVAWQECQMECGAMDSNEMMARKGSNEGSKESGSDEVEIALPLGGPKKGISRKGKGKKGSKESGSGSKGSKSSSSSSSESSSSESSSSEEELDLHAMYEELNDCEQTHVQQLVNFAGTKTQSKVLRDSITYPKLLTIN
jgi:hypothetical protein